MYYGEKFNSISHLVGATLALIGGAIGHRVGTEETRHQQYQGRLHALEESQSTQTSSRG